eukprot:CAMPEP_0178441390 /NCGR_PEP_ID=MMETSP0689_2-20121128/37442_1 /TAXON_ID=160604 /ORGANISM="Amphidinium massartii, Strain CS-259" /LENGTH=204 /DNA_ID=CAMNT_0020064539 /DNA_START=25 /DNA_END=636 /DNA_ORIENTATION=-
MAEKSEEVTEQTSSPDEVPAILGIAEDALPEDLSVCGWKPDEGLSGDENGLRLALLLARNSRCRNGSMGCAVVSPQGIVIAGHINGALWDSPSEKRPSSDIHAEVNAIGHCARRGVSTQGATVFITMPPCRRCFTVLAAAGVRRIVTRKQVPAADAKAFRCGAKNAAITFVVMEDTEDRRGQVQQFVGAVKRKRADANEPDSLR